MLISEYGMGKVGFDLKASFLFSGVTVLLSEFLLVFFDKDIVLVNLELILRFFPFYIDVSLLNIIEVRAWIYIFLMYFFSFPTLFLIVSYLLYDHKMLNHPIPKRFLVSILNVCLSPVAIILPFIVMLEGGDSIGRGGAFYRLFTNSMLGLWILGALMFYAITYIFLELSHRNAKNVGFAKEQIVNLLHKSKSDLIRFINPHLSLLRIIRGL